MSNPFWISPEERVEFYLNGLQSFEIDPVEFNTLQNKDYWNKLHLHLVSYTDYKGTFTHWYCKHIVHLPRIKNIRVLPYYKAYKHLHSLMNFFIPFDKLGLKSNDFQYPMYYGEVEYTDGIPCIRKSRRGNDDISVIYNFRSLRLTSPCETVQKHDISWKDKKENAVWRGATTGVEQRASFVERYFDKYDVGFATTKQKQHLQHLKRSKISIQRQLEYKYIISLEGNDVASNLRWVLASNSIPIMPKPFWQSWIMEDKLEPFVHYLELKDDLSNLEELIDWAKNNDKECEQIALNGKLFMSQFLDEENDIPVQKLLLEEYAKRVSYKKQ
ncbi:MAG: glycosyl transferase family 90 [Reichenbachiella sp.]